MSKNQNHEGKTPAPKEQGKPRKKLSRQARTLIFAGVATVLAACATLIILRLMPGSSEEETKKTYLKRYPQNSLNVLSVNDTRTGYRYALGFISDGGDDSSSLYEFRDAGIDDGYVYSKSKIKTAFSNMANFEVAELVEGSCADPSKYGLTEGSCVQISVHSLESEGEVYSVLVGDKYEFEYKYYVMLNDGSNDVYIAPDTMVNVFLDGSNGFRDLYLLPGFSENYANLNAVRIRKPGMPEIEAVRISEDETPPEGTINYTSFRLTKPYSAFANDSALFDTLLTEYSQLFIWEIVENRPEDLSKYNLETPYELEFDIGGKIHLLKFGQAGSAMYMQIDGIDSVFSVMNMSGGFTFMGLTTMDFRSKLVWAHEIVKVEKVEYFTPGGKHVLTLDDRIDQASGTGTFRAELDGVTLEETEARELYRKTISLTYDEEFEGGEGTIVEEKPSYRFVMTYRSGFKVDVSFYMKNNRQYAVLIGDAPLESAGFSVLLPDLRNVAEAIDTIVKKYS